MKMTNKTKMNIAEYKDFPLRPTKEQLRMFRKKMGINPDLEGMDAVKAFHEKQNIPFDEGKFNKFYTDLLI